MPYRVVFDSSRQGFDWATSAFCLVFVAIGIALVMSLRRDSTAIRVAGAVAYLLFATLAVCSVISAKLYAYNEARTQLQGSASVVEGPITNFVAMPYAGHGDETFQVAGVNFAYSDYSKSIGFNQTSSHGGPLKDGVFVRIHYAHIFGDPIDPAILKLEIRN